MSPEALAAVHAAAFQWPAPWSARDFRAFLADSTCFVELAHHGMALAGFALFRVASGEAELLTLAVAPDARRQGHARRLLAQGLEKARRRGAERCFLEVAESNGAALALYRAAGFAEVGRRKGYYRHHGLASMDALVLEASLK